MWCGSNKKVIHNIYLLLETFGRSIISEKSWNKNVTDSIPKVLSINMIER